MAKHVIKKSYTDNVDITDDHSTWVVAKSVTLSGNWALANTHDDVTLQIQGKLITSGYGIVSMAEDPDDADDTSVIVDKGGRILADEIAVYFDGTGSSINNSGVIRSANNIAVYCFDGADVDITNTGQMIAELDTAIRISWSPEFAIRNDGLIASHTSGGSVSAISAMATVRGQVINGEEGRIDGRIEIDFNSIADITIVNRGAISAELDSISLAAGDDHFVNRGTITGRVHLFDGDDTADLRGGTFINSWVDGGDGDDTYLVDGTGVKIRELMDSGNDTIRTTGSYALGNLTTDYIETLTAIGTKNVALVGNDLANGLNGNSGKNKLSGEGGSDTLAGYGGNDSLTGGDGADHFMFHKKGGNDTILEFDFNADVIHLVGIPGIVTEDDLASRFTAAKNGDAVIDFGVHGSIRLAGIGVGSVDEIEFQIEL
jgi:Ca2+-binding RTX toxin-like protein